MRIIKINLIKNIEAPRLLKIVLKNIYINLLLVKQGRKYFAGC